MKQLLDQLFSDITSVIFTTGLILIFTILAFKITMNIDQDVNKYKEFLSKNSDSLSFTHVTEIIIKRRNGQHVEAVHLQGPSIVKLYILKDIYDNNNNIINMNVIDKQKPEK